jgi:hypothetical protein
MASGLALPGGCPVPIHITGMCRSSNCGMQSSINLMRWSGSFVADLHVSLPRDGSRYQRAASTNIYLSIHRTQLYLRQLGRIRHGANKPGTDRGFIHLNLSSSSSSVLTKKQNKSAQ